MSRAKPASGESLPGGREATSNARAATAARTAMSASSRSGVLRRDGEPDLCCLGSMQVFYKTMSYALLRKAGRGIMLFFVSMSRGKER
jgi:hypothetical protein